MRKIDVEELKQNQLEILDVVAKFCEDNQINYWIDAGTLLGAIRHKGYIPWDDDIDVGMLRPDYDKFMKLFNEKNTRYKFHCIENDPEFFLPHGKVYDTNTILYEPDEKSHKIAINIDIFVYDNATDDDKLAKKLLFWSRFYNMCNLRRMLSIFSLPRKNLSFSRRIIEHVIIFCLRIFPRDFFVKKAIKISRSHISENTKRVGNFTSFTRMTCDKRVFNEFIDVEFEGRKFKAPVGYDEWLRAFYGDYMQLPPVEKRYSFHTFIAYKN